MPAAGLVASLAVLWLALSGHYTPLLLTLGAVSVVFVVWVSQRMEIVDHEQPVHLTLGFPGYTLWLGMKVLQSALRVSRLVWSPKATLRPALGHVPTGDVSDLTRVVYANSITLTPGTLAISVKDDAIDVHSLELSGLEELDDGEMLERARRMEER